MLVEVQHGRKEDRQLTNKQYKQLVNDLLTFISRTAQDEAAPMHAVEALPGTVQALIDLTRRGQILR